MWSLLKRRLNDYETAPKGMNELYERVTKVWYDLMKPEECQKVIESMPKLLSLTVHGIANHPTERCSKYKDLLKQNSPSMIPPPVTPNRSLSFVSVAKNCYRCLGNVPWSKEHAARCPRDKPYHGPTKAIRSVRLGTASSNGNKPNLTITPQARPQQASSKVSSGDSNLMDVDDEGYPY
ncbi:hypothetical protein G6F43_013791 [Rhizopus delemar]|nr:hypothetical protein G6F43_013791 [Rhizopus delemar]